MRATPERSTEDTSLRCSAGGAGNGPADAPAERGWFRCGHCGTPQVVEGAGAFAFETGGGAVTRLFWPGRSELRVRPRLLNRVERALPVILCADLALSIVFAVLEAHVPWIARPLQVGGLAACTAFVLLRATAEQRVLVMVDRAEPCWRAFGVDWSRKAFGTRRHRVPMVKAGSSRVILEVPGGRLRLTADGHASALRLQRELQAATDEARMTSGDDRLPCAGCGGPVATRAKLHRSGATGCPHCGTGLVSSTGGVLLHPAVVRHGFVVPGRAEPDRGRRESGARTWRIPSMLSRQPIAAAFVLGLLLAIAAALVALALAIVREVVLLRVTLYLVAGACVIAAAVLTCFTLGLTLGAQRFRLEQGLLTHELRVGPCRWKRRAVPLGRLLEVGLEWRDAIDQTLPVRTATAGFELDVPSGPRALATVSEVPLALPDALADVGRTARLDTGPADRVRAVREPAAREPAAREPAE